MEEIRVWDRFVRAFHWALVLCMIVAVASADRFDAAHEVAGYSVLTLILLRIVWGFIGPRPARFSSFVAGPRRTLAFLRDTARLKAPRHLGHNPAGGAMVVALIACLLLLTASGIMLTLPAFDAWRWLTALHRFAALTTLGLVALHLAGVFIASVEHRENLTSSMITGRKRA